MGPCGHKYSDGVEEGEISRSCHGNPLTRRGPFTTPHHHWTPPLTVHLAGQLSLSSPKSFMHQPVAFSLMPGSRLSIRLFSLQTIQQLECGSGTGELGRDPDLRFLDMTLAICTDLSDLLCLQNRANNDNCFIQGTDVIIFGVFFLKFIY